jgi:hypothetical protein
MLFYEYYVLRVDLEDVVPRVWRRVVVSPFAKLGGLHRVIAAAMGWDESLPRQSFFAEIFAAAFAPARSSTRSANGTGASTLPGIPTTTSST